MFVTSTVANRQCTDNKFELENYDSLRNLIYLGLLLNTTIAELDIKGTDYISRLTLPKLATDMKFQEVNSLDLKRVLLERNGGFENTIFNRLNSHEQAVSNISVFKILAWFIPILAVGGIVVTIIFLVKTKQIGQLVALSSMIKGGNAAPINQMHGKPKDYFEFIFNILILSILFLVLTYWFIKHYGLLKKIKHTASLPFNECVSTKENPELKLILYLGNMKDYCYLYIDTLPLCMPQQINIFGDKTDLKIIYHSNMCSSYVTLNTQLQIVSTGISKQCLNLPQAIAVSMIQRYTVKTILSSDDYDVQILVGSNNIFRVHPVIFNKSNINNGEIESETCPSCSNSQSNV